MEELFLIRRCYLELHPSPDDPGCIYGEMHKCMAPCQARCTDEQYRAETSEVLAFLKTRGGSRVAELEAERDRASAEMLFEEAAAAHGRVQKVKSAVATADELVQPLSEIRAVLLMPCSAVAPEDPPMVSVYIFSSGCINGPERVSMLGVRLAKEQAEVGSSLFAQPMMLAPVGLDGIDAQGTAENRSPEERMLAAVGKLEGGTGAADVAELGDQLALLRRWYYRPEKQRVGAIFFRERDAWPVRRIVRASAKLIAGAAAEAASETSAATAQEVAL